MSEWIEINIGSIGEVITGNTPLTSDREFYGGKHQFIKPTDMDIDRRHVTKWEENYSEKAFKKYKNSYIPKGSTGVVTIGTVGEKIFQADRPCFTNQSVNVVIPNQEKFDNDFIYYLLKYNLPKVSNANPGTASGRHHVSKSNFCSIKVYVPKEKSIQIRIGKILSAYDDSIENNLKRIKLLEEIAQRTYEEWFVKFRVNGEQLSIDDKTGLPEGWERKSLTSVAEFLNGFAFKPTDWFEEGHPIIKIREMKNGIGKDTPRNKGGRIHNKYLVKKGDILFSWSASLEVIIWQGIDGWLNQHLFKVTPIEKYSREFVYQALLYCLEEFNNLTTGATMKHIKRQELDYVKIAIPNGDILLNFDNLIQPIQNQILNLAHQNRLLKESRDVLLPKLMNGSINVETL